jgi:hypothetical protein
VSGQPILHIRKKEVTLEVFNKEIKFEVLGDNSVSKTIVTRVNSTNVQYKGLRIGGAGRRMNSKVNQSNKVCVESKHKSKLGLLSICPLPSSPGSYI